MKKVILVVLMWLVAGGVTCIAVENYLTSSARTELLDAAFWHAQNDIYQSENMKLLQLVNAQNRQLQQTTTQKHDCLMYASDSVFTTTCW